MKTIQDYKEAYKQQINSQNSENDLNDNHEYSDEVLYNIEPSIHEYNTHPSHHADYVNHPYNTDTVTGGNGNYQQPHISQHPQPNLILWQHWGLYNYVDDNNVGFGLHFISFITQTTF